MKKTFNLILFIFLFQFSFGQIVNIPDTNFKTALLNHFPVIDLNGNSEIEVSEAESFSVGLDLYNQDISDLTGIQSFVNIIELRVGLNNLNVLDVSQNTQLELLEFIHNNISLIDVSQNINLKEIQFNFNSISSIDISNNINLERFFGSYNNNMTSIDFSNNSNLRGIEISNTQIQTVDLSNNTQLTYFNAIDSQLNTIDTSQQFLLDRLLLSGSQVQELDVSNNPNLEYLHLENMFLEEVDFSSNPFMFSFKINNNFLLKTINAQNNNNQNIVQFQADNCPELVCIQVDDAAEAMSGAGNYSHWIKEPSAVYSEEDCFLLNTNVPDFIQNVSISPNPTSDIFYINYPEGFEISYQLLDTKSKVLKKGENSEVNISNLTNGVYFLYIYSDSNVITKKIIKK